MPATWVLVPRSVDVWSHLGIASSKRTRSRLVRGDVRASAQGALPATHPGRARQRTGVSWPGLPCRPPRACEQHCPSCRQPTVGTSSLCRDGADDPQFGFPSSGVYSPPDEVRSSMVRTRCRLRAETGPPPRITHDNNPSSSSAEWLALGSPASCDSRSDLMRSGFCGGWLREA